MDSENPVAGAEPGVAPHFKPIIQLYTVEQMETKLINLKYNLSPDDLLDFYTLTVFEELFHAADLVKLSLKIK